MEAQDVERYSSSMPCTPSFLYGVSPASGTLQRWQSLNIVLFCPSPFTSSSSRLRRCPPQYCKGLCEAEDTDYDFYGTQFSREVRKDFHTFPWVSSLLGIDPCPSIPSPHFRASQPGESHAPLDAARFSTLRFYSAGVVREPLPTPISATGRP